MKTEDLIETLASDLSPRRFRPGTLLAFGLLAAIAAAGLSFAMAIGIRPDFAEAVTSIRFLYKFVVTIAFAASALALLRLCLYPETSGRPPLGLMLVGPALLALGVLVELLSLDQSRWAMAAIGKNWYLCLTVIPALGIVPLGLFIWVLRQGAPTRPVLAGVCAGVLAGAIAATFYAANCTNDSPLFVAIWYPIAVGILAALGGVLGRLFVRW